MWVMAACSITSRRTRRRCGCSVTTMFRTQQITAPSLVYRICCEQTFLASRLLAVAELTVHDLAADIDERGRALAVARVLFSVAAAIEPIAEKVVQAVPAHEWASLLASRKASREQNERRRALVGPK